MPTFPSGRPRLTVLLCALGLIVGCRSRAAVPFSPPAELLGAFLDDYGVAYRITPSVFEEGAQSRYEILEWHVTDQFLIARNASTNRTEPGLWSRFDWVRLPDGGAYRWGYCQTAWKAADAAAARSVAAASRAQLRTGCNGYPFTRMKRVIRS